MKNDRKRRFRDGLIFAAAVILIYALIMNFRSLGSGIMRVFWLFSPLIIGIFFALILYKPMMTINGFFLFLKKKSKDLDLELTSSSILIETGGKKMKKLLIIYYSWSNGNTERIAKMLQSETDSDILKIDTVVPYSGSYDDVVNQGQNEVQRGYEPEIKPLYINIADYDVIAVGTPTWWYTMSPAVKTFLHQQDFTGKTVVPFMTNGGWPGHVIKDMKAACKGANVVCDMQIQFDSTGGSNLETPQEQINEWIQSVKNLL